ncbi:MAG TPA: hypothetical protein VFK10_09585, partial [Burkholderiaceae bacterium]|nr:hypothetical protein [Burkholderiaceae bacterium]
DAAIGGLEGCFLYDIDDLEAVVAETLAGRRAEAARAEQLVAEVRVLPALVAPDADRRVLAVALRDAVQAALHGHVGAPTHPPTYPALP